MNTLLILNDAPYGGERSYNALRLARALSKEPDQVVRVFLMGDAVACAKSGQKVPQGYYNAGDMLHMVGGDWLFTALYSYTATAHKLNRTQVPSAFYVQSNHYGRPLIGHCCRW